MSESLVENKICNLCGAEIRTGALFCYNCGGVVTPISDKDRLENNQENGAKNSRIRPETKLQADVQAVNKTANKPIAKQTVKDTLEMQSAAALRKKPKNIQKKKVEIVWEEDENAPNKWFISMAIFIVVLAVLIIWLALRLK